MNWLRTLGRELRNTPEDPQWRQALWDAIRSAQPGDLALSANSLGMLRGTFVAVEIGDPVARPL